MCRRFILLALMVVVCVPAYGQGAKEKATYPLDPKRHRMDVDADKSATERRQAAAARRTHKNLRQFQDKDGVLTITNIPEKYKGRKGYAEVDLRFSPIVVAQRYQKMASASAYTSSNIADLVKEYAKRYAIEENLVHAVIRAESNGNPYAVSPAGARGLMQLMPETAAEMRVTDLFDPAQNIAGGTQYLAKMLNLFNNDLELALAAYNAGPSTVIQYGGIPPFNETQQYVQRVCSYAGTYAKHGTKPTYLAKAGKPNPGILPTKKSRYLLHFTSGYTQPADKVIDENPYYYVQSGGKTWLIRKEHVEKISEPA